MSEMPLGELERAVAACLAYHSSCPGPEGKCEQATKEAVSRLRKLKERHQVFRGRYIGDPARVCGGCGKSWPCPDAEILEGRDAE